MNDVLHTIVDYIKEHHGYGDGGGHQSQPHYYTLTKSRKSTNNRWMRQLLHLELQGTTLYLDFEPL